MCFVLYLCAQSLAASLQGAWMMPPEWLKASAEAGRWLDEKAHDGWRSTDSPLEGKRVALDSSLAEEGDGRAMRLMQSLVQASRGCKRVMPDLAHPASFDFVVMSREATPADKAKWPAHKQRVYDAIMVSRQTSSSRSPPHRIAAVSVASVLTTCTLFGSVMASVYMSAQDSVLR